jgi:nucleotidyltransferase substrate binding protein (TIGR01987 family)
MSGSRTAKNFGKALAKLQEFAAMPIANDRDRAGIVQAFEFTFEQCWKTFQQAAARQGITVGSPRQSLQAAVQLGLIAAADEETWLDMMRDRNVTSHLYHEAWASEIAERIVSRYLLTLENAWRVVQPLA